MSFSPAIVISVCIIIACMAAAVTAALLFYKKKADGAADKGAKAVMTFDATEDAHLIHDVLELALEKRAAFKVRLNNRGRSFSSTILKVDESAVFIDVLFPYEGNELIADSKFLNIEFIIKQIAHVPYTFSALYMNSEVYDGYPCLRITLPNKIVRDQKRNYHRVSPSVNDPVYVKFELDGEPVSEKVANISGGGLGFFTNFGKAVLWNKREIRHAEITIPEPVTIELMTIVYTASQAQYPVLIGGKPYYYYCGAEFVGLDTKVREQIIRYVIEKEREELKRINRLM